MKSLLHYSLLSAIVLVGGVGITACSSDDELTNETVNPSFNPTTDEVTTQFVFNVSTGNTATTRMSADNTQAVEADNFRGMQDVHLLAYKLDYNKTANGGGSHVYDVSTTELATAARDYDLARLLGAKEIKPDLSRRIIELSLPVGANTLMFYGRAQKTGTDDAQGSIVFNPQKVVTESSFTLNPRLANRTVWNETTEMISIILTRITQTGLTQESPADGSKLTRDLRYAFWWPINGDADIYDLNTMTAEQLAAVPANGTVGTGDHAGQTFYIGTKLWSDYGADFDNHEDMSAMEEVLGEAYSMFTTLGVNRDGMPELRAGSASSVLHTVRDLAGVVNKVRAAQPSSVADQIAKLMAQRIFTRLNSYFNEVNTNATWKTPGNTKTAIETYVAGKVASDFSNVTTIETFPNNLHMPKGSSLLDFDAATKEWSYLEYLPTYGMGGGTGTTGIMKYRYPAELCYFGNSPLRVSDDVHETAHYPATVSTWDNDATWEAGDLRGANGWTKDAAVQSTSRSVAMQKDINYGTSLLKATVRYGAATLEDNRHYFHENEANNQINATADAFKLTGILIGGQSETVGWNFINKGSSFDHIIYDSEISDRTIPAYNADPAAGKSAPNYTLLWDNCDCSLAVDQQSPVYVLLEFENNSGKDFWGDANMIRNGATFYIIGKLDPQSYSFPSRVNTNYNLPPYDNTTSASFNANNGKTVEAVRVFIQDYMTSADFVIGPTSLQKAYITVPDLRASQVSLGLSVDIKWETGLSFENVILGE